MNSDVMVLRKWRKSDLRDMLDGKRESLWALEPCDDGRGGLTDIMLWAAERVHDTHSDGYIRVAPHVLRELTSESAETKSAE